MRSAHRTRAFEIPERIAADVVFACTTICAFNGGAFTVPAALGSKVIHPYSDFLAHDVGTGDGIPVLPLPEYAETTTMIRTAPLWALRTRNRLMHDGLAFTKEEAIQRHRGQANSVRLRFNELTPAEQQQVLRFLDSL
jgi:CxxC motif-containing protein (DUF1111 family)